MAKGGSKPQAPKVRNFTPAGKIIKHKIIKKKPKPVDSSDE
jgi:hypothetical protein|tara:strand:- start:275 stop:397 length:123 start_codon:yes stop_codon:yes gene_type:complete